MNTNGSNSCCSPESACGDTRTETSATQRPATNLRETPTGFELLCALPGVNEKDVEVKLEGDLLTIRGEMKLDEPSGMRVVHAEFEPARWLRRFQLGQGLDPASIRANLRDGMLRLTVDRRAPNTTRIPINQA